jgi:hypothetical protein
MSDRFAERCTCGLENYVKELFDTAPRIPGTGMGEIPAIGGVFLLGAPCLPTCFSRSAER